MKPTEQKSVERKTKAHERIKQEASERKAALRETLSFLKVAPKPVVFEIGCGNGHYLTAYSKEHPEKLCIGIDVFSHRLRRSNSKKNNNELKNLHFIKAEANEFIEMFPTETTINEIFILFPDPWPKRRHHKNRLIQPKFLTALARICKKDSPLYFRTDDSDYFKWTAAHIEAHSLWSTSKNDPWPFEAETLFQKRAPSYNSLVARRVEG